MICNTACTGPILCTGNNTCISPVICNNIRGGPIICNKTGGEITRRHLTLHAREHGPGINIGPRKLPIHIDPRKLPMHMKDTSNATLNIDRKSLTDTNNATLNIDKESLNIGRKSLTNTTRDKMPEPHVKKEKKRNPLRIHDGIANISDHKLSENEAPLLKKFYSLCRYP